MKREAPIGTTWTLRIEDHWTPTPANINALPEPLRAYIRRRDRVVPAEGREQMLRWECERLARESR